MAEPPAEGGGEVDGGVGGGGGGQPSASSGSNGSANQANADDFPVDPSKSRRVRYSDDTAPPLAASSGAASKSIKKVSAHSVQLLAQLLLGSPLA